MEVMKQLSIFLENRPGTLARACRALADKSINVLGLTVADTIDHSVIRMVVNDPLEAAHILGEAGVLVIESDVIAINLPNEPGKLAEAADRLARAEVNIEYAYASAGQGTHSRVYFRVSDNKKAQEALQGL